MHELDFLLKGYSNEMRTNVNPYRFAQRKEKSPAFQYEPGDRTVHETLMEHVGTLPILATYFHGHVTEPVNLGRVLELLAVHDIGEIVVGDESTFTKKEDEGDIEQKEALKILNEKHHAAYLEFKENKTNEAKFAKSVDKIAPDILDVLTDIDITAKRLKHFANIELKNIPNTIEKFKSPHMQWSTFFREFHAELIKKLRGMFV